MTETNPSRGRCEKNSVPVCFVRLKTQAVRPPSSCPFVFFDKKNEIKITKRAREMRERPLAPLRKKIYHGVGVDSFLSQILGIPPYIPFVLPHFVLCKLGAFSRCRVDAEAAVRVRREQFRLRCKTKWERRRKALEVRRATCKCFKSIKMKN